MTRDEILRRLDAVAEAKVGGPIPAFLDKPNDWGSGLSELAREAAALIRGDRF